MNRINGHTALLGLLGYPVAHTLSPLIHNSLAEYYGDDLVYVPFEVKPEDLSSAVAGAFSLGIRGLNCTVPHKSAVIPCLEKVDPVALSIGAVNTLVRGEKGYIGYNTDHLGLLEAMREENIPLEGENVLILGAGGAARAAVAMCAVQGAAKIIIANRTREKAEALAQMAEGLGGALAEAVSLEELYERLQSRGPEDYLAIQCSSVGLAPDAEHCILDSDERVFSRIHTGVDLIYKPAETLFLQKLKADGKKAMNGAKMLLYQAVIAYEMWKGSWSGRIGADKKILDEIFANLDKER